MEEQIYELRTEYGLGPKLRRMKTCSKPMMKVSANATNNLTIYFKATDDNYFEVLNEAFKLVNEYWVDGLNRSNKERLNFVDEMYCKFDAKLGHNSAKGMMYYHGD